MDRMSIDGAASARDPGRTGSNHRLRRSLGMRKGESGILVDPASRKLCSFLLGQFEIQARHYLKSLRRCQKRFSEQRIHELRVATRRLRANLHILENFAEEETVVSAERRLKKLFKALAPLRETQVERAKVKPLRTLPVANGLHKELKVREGTLKSRLKKKVRRLDPTRFKKTLKAVKKRVHDRVKGSSTREAGIRGILTTLKERFGDTVERVRKIDPSKTETVHRARVAFKHFRYLLEALHPAFVSIPRTQFAAMNEYQTAMGGVQDLAVLLRKTSEYARSRKAGMKRGQRLLRELEKQQKLALAGYLRFANRILAFWPRKLESESRIRPEKSHLPARDPCGGA